MTGCTSFETLCSLFAGGFLAQGLALAGGELSDFQRSRLAEAMTAQIRKLGDMAFPAARTPRVSAAAQQIADSLGCDLRAQTWHSQKKIDGYKLFTYEHLHPVREIRGTISKATTIAQVMEALDRMLWVAWITKEEDKRLRELGFASIRSDPARAYEGAGIELLPDDAGAEADLIPGVVTASVHADPGLSGPACWGTQDMDVFATLIDGDVRWRDVLVFPGRWHFGPTALRVMAEAVRRGWQVGFGDQLTLEREGIRLEAHLTESWNAETRTWPGEQNHWARLYATIGPFPDSAEADRALTDFAMHGPFENNGMRRRDGRAHLRIGFRLVQDLEGLFTDLDNIPRALDDLAAGLWAEHQRKD